MKILQFKVLSAVDDFRAACIQWGLDKVEGGFPFRHKETEGETVVVNGSKNMPAEMHKLYRENAQTLWEQKGRFATMDLFNLNGATHWEEIMVVLGINPQEGRQRIREAVRAFTASNEYADLVEAVSNLGWTSARGEFYKTPDWWDANLGDFLAGKNNAKINSSSLLSEVADGVFARPYYLHHRPARQTRYQTELIKQLNAGAAVTPKTFSNLDISARETFLGKQDDRSTYVDKLVWARSIDACTLPPEQKKDLLSRLFQTRPEHFTAFDPNGHYFNAPSMGPETWADAGKRPRNVEILKILQKNGASEKVIPMLDSLLTNKGWQGARPKFGYTSYFQTITSLFPEIQRELTENLASLGPNDGGKLVQLSRVLANPKQPEQKYDGIVQVKELRQLKDAIAQKATEIQFKNVEEKIACFRNLTETGTTLTTDTFFESQILPDLNGPLNSKTHGQIEGLLADGRIRSEAVRLDLVKRIVSPELPAIARLEDRAEALTKLIIRINRYLPEGSKRKDEFLESIAWKLNLNERELWTLIEENKSYQWRKVNPLWAKLGSSASLHISRMTAEGRKALIKHLLDPDSHAFPDSLVKEIRTAIELEAEKNNFILSHPNVQDGIDRTTEETVEKLEAFIYDATPFEKIPLIELAVASGDSALSTNPDYAPQLAREFMSYQPDSQQEKFLRAFLKVIPDHERSVTISYLLSQSGKDKSSAKDIFEVFQAVGKKFAQLGATFNIFGEQLSAELSDLKDNATPLTMAEVTEIMNKRLGPEERRLVKPPLKILGSASLKTVVLVELADGRQVVMLVQPDNVNSQNQTNLELGQRFLKMLAEEGIVIDSKMQDATYRALGVQLERETHMTQEAQNLREAGTVFEKLNTEMADTLGGWKFHVPQPIPDFKVRDDIMFVERATGETFLRASQDVQATTGRPIFQGSIRGLIKYGIVNFDPHAGNFMVDPATKTIFPIDYGQFGKFARGTAFWRPDERHELANFITAFGNQDGNKLVDSGLNFSEEPITPEARGKLKARVAGILADPSATVDTKLISVVEAFAENGAPLEERVSFGAIKALMLLSEEDYLKDRSAQADVLKHELTGHYLRNPVRAVADKVKSASGFCADVIRRIAQPSPPSSPSTIRIEEKMKNQKPRK